MRRPGHTIQFLNFRYTQYNKKVLKLVEINSNKIEWRLYDDWIPYHSERRKDKLQSFKKDQSYKIFRVYNKLIFDNLFALFYAIGKCQASLKSRFFEN